MKRLVFAMFLLLLVGCTDPENAKRILTENGYTNIEMQGYDWAACSKDDVYHDRFTAVGPTGHTIHGTVCKGTWKNTTIRFE